MVAPLGSTSWKPLSSKAFKVTLGQQEFSRCQRHWRHSMYIVTLVSTSLLGVKEFIFKTPLHPCPQPHRQGSLKSNHTWSMIIRYHRKRNPSPPFKTLGSRSTSSPSQTKRNPSSPFVIFYESLSIMKQLAVTLANLRGRWDGSFLLCKKDYDCTRKNDPPCGAAHLPWSQNSFHVRCTTNTCVLVPPDCHQKAIWWK